MNKLNSFAILIALVAFASLISCKHPIESTTSKSVLEYPGPEWLDTKGVPKFPGTDRLETVPFIEAKSNYTRYKGKFRGKLERNWISFNNNIPAANKQTKCVWFTIDQLRAFVRTLDAIDSVVKGDNKYRGQGLEVSGLRVYYTAYPKNDSKEVNRRKLTVTFCATYDLNGKHYDMVKRGKILAIDGYYNHGHLCPPETNCEGALLDGQ